MDRIFFKYANLAQQRNIISKRRKLGELGLLNSIVKKVAGSFEPHLLTNET